MSGKCTSKITRVAVFKSVRHGFELVLDNSMGDVSGYVRVSEFIDVEFPPLSDDKQIQLHVKELDAERTRLVRKHCEELAVIDERKSRLLALTHDKVA